MKFKTFITGILTMAFLTICTVELRAQQVDLLHRELTVFDFLHQNFGPKAYLPLHTTDTAKAKGLALLTSREISFWPSLFSKDSLALGPVSNSLIQPLSLKGLVYHLPKVSLPDRPTVPAMPVLPAVKTDVLNSKVNAVKGQLTDKAGSILNTPQVLSSQVMSQFKPIGDAVSKNFKSLKNPSFSAALSLENDLQYNPVSLVPMGSKFANVIGVRGNVVVMGVPLTISISNNKAAFDGRDPLGGNLYKMGFSPNMFSGLLRNQLQQYAALKNTIFNGFNFTDYVRQTVNEQVRSLQNNVSGSKGSPFTQLLGSADQLQGLFSLSDQKVKLKLRALAEEQNKIAADSAGKMLPLTDAEQALNLKRADSLAAVITAVKTELKAKGIDPAKVILQENYLTGRTALGFNNSESILGLVDKQPANGLQNAFSSIKDLRFGTFGNTLPGAADGGQAKLMNGGSLTVKLGLYPLTAGFGSLNDLNSLKDAAYQNSVYTYPKRITFIGAEMPRSAFGNVKISIISSASGQSNNAQYAVPTLPGNTVAFTVTKTMNMDKWGRLAMDVSKSATLFDNSFHPGSEAILLKKAGANYDLANNLFQSFSVGFRHNLDIRQLDASDNVYFNYAGLGYQNPANSGYSGASMKFGGDLKKSFYKRKLLLDLRSDFSSTPLSYTNNNKFKNYQVQFSSRYQVSNRFNVSLKYLASGTAQQTDGTSNSVYSSQKLQMDANNTYKIGTHFATSRISIGDQSFKNTYTSSGGSNLLNVTYVQSLVFKTSSLTGVFFYNKELTSSQLLGDMLTSDITYQYQFFKVFQLHSGFTYLSNAAYAKQAGLKQGLQVAANKHFDIGASLNVMKNLVTPLYADLYPSCRGEISVKYNFKID